MQLLANGFCSGRLACPSGDELWVLGGRPLAHVGPYLPVDSIGEIVLWRSNTRFLSGLLRRFKRILTTPLVEKPSSYLGEGDSRLKDASNNQSGYCVFVVSPDG